MGRGRLLTTAWWGGWAWLGRGGSDGPMEGLDGGSLEKNAGSRGMLWIGLG